jgi:hypothetical protein
MSVGFRLRGRYKRNLFGRPSTEDVIAQVAAVWRELEPDLVDLDVTAKAQPPNLLLRIHPAVEPLEFSLPSPGIVEISANTSSGGPGYHRRMCDDIREVGRRLGLSWDPSDGDQVLDETGYFETGDAAAVDRTMLDWLGSVLRAVATQVAAGGNQIAISLPLGVIPAGYDEDIITTLGPRDDEWLKRGVENPHHAIDIFPWWNDTRDAAYYRNRALSSMWVDIRWVAPIDDANRDQLVAVDRDLTRALELDSAATLPWREWAQVRGLLEHSGAVGVGPDLDRLITERAKSVDPAAPVVGYRRNWIRMSPVGGWSLDVPGSFVDTVEGGAWIGFDAERSVRLTSLSATENDGSVPSADELAVAAPRGDSPIPPGHPDLRGQAIFVPAGQDGEEEPTLSGLVAVAGEVLIVTIVYGREEAWARRAWSSIRARARPASSDGQVMGSTSSVE